tara:strand:- start:19589 stop:21121 length:1533 start_codon:yes stop_codon:yes gene_type:complete
MSNRKSNALKGFISILSGSFVLQLVSLLVIPLYLNLTSQELFGLWLTLGAILGWIKIGDMGVGLALQRRSIETLEKDDYKLLSRLIYGAALITLTFGFFISGLGFLMSNLLVKVFNISNELQTSFINTYHILLIVAFIRPAFGLLTAVIGAKQHLAFMHIKNTSITILSILVTITLLYLDFGLISFAYGLLFEAIFTLLIDFTYLKYKDSQIVFFPVKTSKSDIRSLLGFGAPFQILKITNLVATSTDNIIIAAFLGASSVTVYVFTGKLALLIATFIIGTFPSVLFSGISQLFEIGDIKKIKKLYLNLSDLMIRLGILSGISYFYINEIFIGLWVGAENFGGNDLTALFVIWCLFHGFCSGISNIIYASGDLKGLTVISLVEASLNLTLTLILIKSFGLLGVIFATIISKLLVTIYIPLKINKILYVSSLKFFKNMFLKVLFYLIPLIIVGEFISSITLNYSNSVGKITIVLFSMLLTSIFMSEGLLLLRNRKKTFRENMDILKEFHGL